MLALKQFRNKAMGLPDLLNYAALVDDGVVLNKDGSLMAGFYYRGLDISSATEAERNGVSRKINAVLARLGSGWMTHHDAIRIHSREYPETGLSHFPDPITELIDRERARHFRLEGTHYESIYAVIVSYMPPLRRNSNMADMMYDDSHDSAKSLQDKLLDKFKRDINDLGASLANTLKISRMHGMRYVDEWGKSHINDQLLQYLNFSITGNFHPINIPPCPMYLDAVIGCQELWGGVTPKLGDKFIAVVSIDGMPHESYHGILVQLDKIPIQYRWNTRFIYMDTVESLAYIKQYRRHWQQKVRGFADQLFKTQKGPIDQDALMMVGETESAIASASSNLVAFGYYTSVIVLMDKDRETLDENARDVQQTIMNLGFSSRIETINSMEAWLGSLPGHGVANVRRPMIHTLNLSDMLPLQSIWVGHAFCPCPNYPPKSPPLLHGAAEGATPFRLNLHVGDVGHTLVFGPTGAGKSTLLALIAAQFRRYENATVFAFDKGNSLYPLTKAIGGIHYDIGADKGGPQFCPLAEIKTPQDAAWAEEWIETLISLQGVVVSPRHRSEIHRAMTLFMQSQSRTLTDFVTTLQDKPLREALEYYTISGTMGFLLDNTHDDLMLGAFQTFEIEELMNMGEKNLIPVLLYIFNRIEKRLQGQPALLILDEAWIMLGHPVFRDKIREWLKVLRKANCAVLLATQSLSDASRSGIMDVLQESCPTKILLPNEEANSKLPKELYENLGLNVRQIDILAGAIKKKQYYFVSPEGFRLFELALGPIAMSFVGASSREDIHTIRKMVDQFSQNWPWEWLQLREVNYEM